MGEIAEMMLDGIMCEGCGEWMEDDFLAGHPRRCAACSGGRTVALLMQKPKKRIKCQWCSKRFAADAARDQHARAKHPHMINPDPA